MQDRSNLYKYRSILFAQLVMTTGRTGGLRKPPWSISHAEPIGSSNYPPLAVVALPPQMWLLSSASSDCQAKCNTFFKKSFGDKNPRHLRGRLLIRETTASNCSCVTLLKSVPLGKKKRTNPFMFSLLPRCQGA